jgi:hypothetical protein
VDLSRLTNVELSKLIKDTNGDLLVDVRQAEGHT